ncbi:hypothetical protein ACFLTV_02845 [Chloroflexota bacterium]
MQDININQLIIDGDFLGSAQELVKEYVGENIRSFEKEDLDRRARVLEMQIRENKPH